MKQDIDKELLIQIAHMYYDQDMTQQQIANKMNMSRSLVSKLLTKAKNAGIVEVIVHSEITHPYKEIEDRIKQILGLKYVKVVEDNQNKNMVAVEAGRYLARRLSDCKNVALSSSRSIRDVALEFSPTTTFPNVTFVPMAGGLDEVQWRVDTNNTCATLAEKSGSKSMLLHTPIIVDSMEAKEVLMHQFFIKNVLDRAKQADLALVGIGSSFQWFELEEAFFHGKKDDYIPDPQIVCGDISYNYFDKNGELVDCKWNRQMMGLSLDEIKAIPEVICVATEVEKAESLYIAAKYKIIHSMIINLNVAKRILLYYTKNIFN